MNSTAPLFTFRPPPPPAPCSPSWLSSCSISSLPENGRWESIPHHKSNHIILSFSITTLSLPPSLPPPHSITLPFSSPSLLLPRSPCPSQNRIYSVVKAGWGLSPTLICNSWSLPTQFSEKVGTEYFRHTSLVHLVLAHKTCPPTTSHLCCAALTWCKCFLNQHPLLAAGGMHGTRHCWRGFVGEGMHHISSAIAHFSKSLLHSLLINLFM